MLFRSLNNPVIGAIAQLGERNTGSVEVGGSIPPSSTKQKIFFCRVRLSVRTPGFHPGKRGSIPLRDANFFY